MTLLEDIAGRLKKDLPAFNFAICRRLFERYIAVVSHGHIIFAIRVNKRSGHRELLDEADLFMTDWLKKRCKSSLFHWSKYRNQWRRDYPGIILEKMEPNLAERKQAGKRLELSLQNMYIT
ncbi:MAG: hypothetical protein Q8941_01320 [Bacteroidota bacterium]|nr:hypothetical protein [Bacteroidota bacterium]